MLNYNIEELEKLSFDFQQATGISLQILDTQFHSLHRKKAALNAYCRTIQRTPQGIASCAHSDYLLLTQCKQTKKPAMHICHAGLVDIAIPILHNDAIIGYLILGQMKTKEALPVADRLTSCKREELLAHYHQLTDFDETKIQSMERIAVILAKYLLLDNLLKPTSYNNLALALDFIHSHLNQSLTVCEISRNTHISPSGLYKMFHTHFQCTVSQYVNKKRIEWSEQLLLCTDLSVEEISLTVGFSSASYYSKLFKNEKGISPLKFRQQCNT